MVRLVIGMENMPSYQPNITSELNWFSISNEQNKFKYKFSKIFI